MLKIVKIALPDPQRVNSFIDRTKRSGTRLPRFLIHPLVVPGSTIEPWYKPKQAALP